MVMRATASLVVTVVAAIAIAAGTGAPSGPPPSILAAAPADAPQAPPDGFDGLLYPESDTGCIRPWREGDGDPVTAEDIWGPRSAPPNPSVRVQDPAPLPEPFGETQRGPWPLCNEPPAKVHESGS
jgi:hypothetical protein